MLSETWCVARVCSEYWVVRSLVERMVRRWCFSGMVGLQWPSQITSHVSPYREVGLDVFEGRFRIWSLDLGSAFKTGIGRVGVSGCGVGIGYLG